MMKAQSNEMPIAEWAKRHQARPRVKDPKADQECHTCHGYGTKTVESEDGWPIRFPCHCITNPKEKLQEIVQELTPNQEAQNV